MNLIEIQTIIHSNINSATPDVDQYIIDSVNFLSNFFHLNKTDVSETSVSGQSWISYATDFLKMKQLVIDGVYIKELLSDEHRENIAVLETQRWYIADGKIQLTKAMSETGKAIIIIYESSFIQPEIAVDTDVPTKLLELVYLGATYRYFNKLVSIVSTEREDQPDITPAEIAIVAKYWRKSFDDLLKSLI